ncbi:MAG TPA: hypothetical protein VKU41_08320 [Polyangiaceae bacterium]|nr:hypothetical protein [Polyangiaceae bacterium]
MSTLVTGVTPAARGGGTFDVVADGVKLSVEFAREEDLDGKPAWAVCMTFADSRNVQRSGTTRREAFDAMRAQYEKSVKNGVPLPTLDLAALGEVLAARNAFERA